MLRYPQISKSLAFRTKNKYFPQGFKDFHHFSCLFQVKDISLQKNNRQWIEWQDTPICCHKLLSRNMLVPKSFHLALEPRMTSHGQTTSRQIKAKVRIFVEGEKEGFLYWRIAELRLLSSPEHILIIEMIFLFSGKIIGDESGFLYSSLVMRWHLAKRESAISYLVV